MTDSIRTILNQMVQAIVEVAGPEQIILFGSWAKGDADINSDVDLLIVESMPFGKQHSRRQEMAKLWRALAKFPVSKDILVYDRQEIEQWRGSLNHVVGRALREGEVLYAKN